ncbi:MAG: multi-sensor signal transduction histidine kinase [Actinomycetia bacterium]|nr:multi-sensor signal transduction histidine kinase [Actinomycetes bacterium]
MPEDEQGRIEALHALQILDTPSEERFDRITRMAARVLGVPITLVSLIDTDRQWFKSCIGLDQDGTSRRASFCGHTILQEGLFVVPDALADPRFADNPMVVGEPRVRFYAGHPLHGPDGHRIGTLCVLDREPRTLTDDERAALEDLAAWAELELGSIERGKARDTERRLMTLLASVGDGIATFDINGIVTSANAAAEAMFRRPEDEIVGHLVSDLVHPEDRTIVITALVERAESDVGTLFEQEIRGLRADGTSFPMDTTVSEVVDHEGELFIAIARDVTGRREAAEELANLQRYTARILDSVGDGIVGVDRTGRVTFVNRAAGEMLLRRPAELIGEPFHEVAHHSRPDGSPYPWEECPMHDTLFGGSAVREYDELFWRADGSSFFVELVTTPLADPDRVVGAVVAFRDVTERRAIDRMKDEFVSVVSHELRTPLTSIRGSLGLLAGGAFGTLPDEASQMLDLAVDNTDRLVRLVNDILDLERLRAGQVALDLRVADLTDLAAKAVAAVASATTNGVQVRVSGFPAPVWVDADRMMQVITNLVGNAIKFSDAEGVVDVHVATEGGEGVLRVTDHGRGIPPELLEQIFDRFQQVDATDAREKGGTGLGLAIARSIVEQHGGRIWAESTEGVGATFSVAVPGEAAS